MSFILRITGPESPREFAIPLGTSTIGRESGREVVLAHPLVSRLHARLTCSEQECQITDLGSANGSLVGEEALTPQVPYLLKTGDILTIGPFKLLFDQVQVGTPIETGAAVSTAAGEEEIALAAEEAGAEQEIEEPVAAGEAAPPVPPPPAPQEYQPEGPGDGLERLVPPGLSLYSRQLLRYLPGIYNTDFMSRFLALFESIQIPIQWNVDNFDLFLDPGTSPYGFLPWLAHWFEVVFDDSWSENQRRAFLKDAHLIYSRHGTRWALGHVLEIYTGFVPDIVDIGQNLAPHTFMIQFPFPEAHRRADLLGRIIDEHKPAHTSYTMKFKG